MNDAEHFADATCGCRPPLSLAGLGLPRAMGRRELLRGVSAALSMALAGCVTIPEQHQVAAGELASQRGSVDLHAHPGMLKSSPLSMESQVERMGRGRVKTVLFAAVADRPLIGRRPSGGLYSTREPRAGELYTATWRQIDQVRKRVSSGALKLVRAPADVDALARDGATGAMLAAEGGDFLEGKIERVEEAHRRDLRSIQLVHYRVNELGDIQTEPARHGGLTAFGKDVIREMNRLGMVVDLAHLTHDGVRQAVAVTKKPLILSHTVLETPFARSVSRDHARLVAETGGVIGIFPVNSSYHGFSGYITHIERMIASVGVDHVGIGTDMDGISPPSFLAYDDYREWPSIGAALLARGHSREDVAKVLGGNFGRVFQEVAAI
jgi:membrane dipeptidase